jgi:hypothetical protein
MLTTRVVLDWMQGQGKQTSSIYSPRVENPRKNGVRGDRQRAFFEAEFPHYKLSKGGINHSYDNMGVGL